jgi:hypothetical protein
MSFLLRAVAFAAPIFVGVSHATAAPGPSIEDRVDTFCATRLQSVACLNATQAITRCKLAASGFNAMWETFWRIKPQTDEDTARVAAWRAGVTAGFPITEEWLNVVAKETPAKMRQRQPNNTSPALAQYYQVCVAWIDEQINMSAPGVPIPPATPSPRQRPF